MKKTYTAPKTASSLVTSPRAAAKLIALVQSSRRKYAKGLIESHLAKGAGVPAMCAAYQSRVAHSIVTLEGEEAKRAKESGRRDPVAYFTIDAVASAERQDPALGVCHMAYHSFSVISSGLWAGCVWLERETGGVTFSFLDGLPEGATASIFLNWSLGPRKATFSPGTAAIPRGVLTVPPTGVEGRLPDFQWTVVRPCKPALVCVNATGPSGAIVVGSTCRVFYY